MINVSHCATPQRSWDAHSQNFRQLRTSLAPTFDAALAALIADMAAMLDHLLGMDPTTTVHDDAGSPHRFIIGRPVEGVLA